MGGRGDPLPGLPGESPRVIPGLWGSKVEAQPLTGSPCSVTCQLPVSPPSGAASKAQHTLKTKEDGSSGPRLQRKQEELTQLGAQLLGPGDSGMESVALYSFQATESDELAFNKGDTLKVGGLGWAELGGC